MRGDKYKMMRGKKTPPVPPAVQANSSSKRSSFAEPVAHCSKRWVEEAGRRKSTKDTEREKELVVLW